MKHRSLLLSALLSFLCTTSVAAQDPTPTPTIDYGDGSARQLKIYDLRPYLRATTVGVDGPEIRVPLSSREPNAAEGGSVDLLADAISTFVQPSFTGPEEVKSISGTHLVVNARPAQHLWIARFLKRQVEGSQTQMRFEARLLTVPKGTRIPGADGEPIQLRTDTEPMVLSGEYRDEVLRSLGKTKQLEELAMPSLICLPNQLTSVSTESQTSYVRDYELLVLEKNGELIEIADPVVDTVSDGIELAGSLTHLAEDRIGVNFRLTRRELRERPIPTVEMEIGVKQRKVVVQRPSWSEFEIEAIASITPGDTMQFVTGSEDKLAILLITARPIGD